MLLASIIILITNGVTWFYVGYHAYHKGYQDGYYTAVGRNIDVG
jgi:hypothetical protein